MKLNNTRHLTILFILAVVIPGIILSLIAIRAAGRENAYIEYRMRNTFVSEITLTKTIAKDVLINVTKELDSIFAIESDTFKDFDSIQSLVEVPFILSEKREILWPLYNEGLSNRALDFFKFNKEFFQDRVPTPIYKSVDLKSKKSKIATRRSTDEVDGLIRDLMKERKEQKSSYKKSYKKDNDYYLNNKLTQITINKVDQASKLKGTVEYVESLKFSQIVEKQTSGIIPRLIDNQIMLLYWKKTDDNEIQGGVVNEKEISERIIKRIPQIYTEARVLTLLDQNRRPLFIPEGKNRIDWGNPFLSQDLHELLPQWEVATYLTNPDQISNQARINTIVIGLLVTMLFTTFTFGGILIIRSLQAELKLAQQKTTFVANVSHELKTPLTSIRIFAEILKEKRQPDEKKQKNYLSIMVSEIERLTRLINNVLDFSQSQKGNKQYKFRRVDIVGLCNELIEIQKVRLEHNGFIVSIQSAIDEAFVDVDEEAIKQAFVNIISNAEKYSPEEKDISLIITSNRNFVTIDIADKGIGVDAKHRQNIFNEFYRADDSLTASVRGTGLGLTITKKIIEDNHGTIEYVKNVPKGSIFRIILPLAGE